MPNDDEKTNAQSLEAKLALLTAENERLRREMEADKKVLLSLASVAPKKEVPKDADNSAPKEKITRTPKEVIKSAALNYLKEKYKSEVKK